MNTTKTFLTLILLLVLTSVAFSQDNLPKPISKLLNRANLTFQKPVGFQQTKTIDNRHLKYNYALKDSKRNFEIRYVIRPLDSTLVNYEEFVKNNEKSFIIHPNKMHSMLFKEIILNLSGGRHSKITEFDKKSVSQEFNADWGAMTFIEVGKEFGQNYEFGMILAIHKDNIGDAYCIFLSKNEVGFKELLADGFHSLKFK